MQTSLPTKRRETLPKRLPEAALLQTFPTDIFQQLTDMDFCVRKRLDVEELMILCHFLSQHPDHRTKLAPSLFHVASASSIFIGVNNNNSFLEMELSVIFANEFFITTQNFKQR